MYEDILMKGVIADNLKKNSKILNSRGDDPPKNIPGGVVPQPQPGIAAYE